MITCSNGELLGEIRGGVHLSGVGEIVPGDDESAAQGLVYGFAAGDGGRVLCTFSPFPAGTRNEGWISVDVRPYEGVSTDLPSLVAEHVRGCQSRCKYMVRGVGHLQESLPIILNENAYLDGVRSCFERNSTLGGDDCRRVLLSLEDIEYAVRIGESYSEVGRHSISHDRARCEVRLQCARNSAHIAFRYVEKEGEGCPVIESVTCSTRLPFSVGGTETVRKIDCTWESIFAEMKIFSFLCDKLRARHEKHLAGLVAAEGGCKSILYPAGAILAM
jgi:hypothetical protein